MAPSAITPPHGVEQTADLTAAAIKSKIEAAPSTSTSTTSPPQPPPTSSPPLQPLRASPLLFTRNPSPKPVPAAADPIRTTSSFCTDHMISVAWSARTGWAPATLVPYGPLAIMPTASVLHYATECFEGMKAYRGHDGALRLFRPDCNARRMVTSAARIALPVFDPAELEKLVLALMEVDGAKFLPTSVRGQSIYLRPTLIGTQAALGVQVPQEALLYVIATYMPAWGSIAGGMKLLASLDSEVRAWPGGFGFAKVGANYGPSLMAAGEARRRGYDQVLWLFGKEGRVTEAGASNFFVVWREKGTGKVQVVTAPLGDKVILDGVTRRSVIQLVQERLDGRKNEWLAAGDKVEAVEVVQREYTMGEVVEAVREGRMIEAFACGTAYFVCPVSTIHYGDEDLKIPMVEGETGTYARVIKDWISDIMYGNVQHEWGVVVDESKAVM